MAVGTVLKNVKLLQMYAKKWQQFFFGASGTRGDMISAKPAVRWQPI